MQKRITILFLIISCIHTVQSQDSTETVAAKKFNISGYADMYYNVSFNNPGVGATLWGPAAGSRAFDINNKQFSLGLIQGKVQYLADKMEVVADLMAGPNATLASLAAFKNSSFPLSLGGGVFAIKQLYGVWKPSDKLSFTIGQFGTHIGYEVIESSLNYHYSLSNLFNNGPFFHTGLKLNYAISDKVGLMAGLVNSWDSYDDNNGFKSPVLQLSIIPADGLTLYLNYLGGKGDRAGSLHPIFDQLSDVNGFSTHIFDITASYAASSKLNLGFNWHYGVYDGGKDVESDFKKITKNKSDAPKWGGVAAYLNYAITDQFSLGTRLEHFEDYYGVRYLGGINDAITITSSIALAGGNVLLKPELRIDAAKGNNNVNGHVDLYNDKTGTTDNQTTFGVAAIFKISN